MLLTRLVEYAREHQDRMPPPYYKDAAVRWVLHLHADGSLAERRLVDRAGDALGERRGKVATVPSITKASGIAPTLAVDSLEYVFGWLSEGKKPDRVRAQHKEFTDLVDAWVKRFPDGPGAVLQAFYRDGHADRVLIPHEWSPTDKVAVRVAGQFLHEDETARVYWAEVAGARKTTGQDGVCLVCGGIGPLLKTIPQQLPARLVPNATQSASLVSVNKATHGFALQEQLVHTPICVTCGLSAMNALEQLLSDRTGSSVTGQDTRLAWWITGSSDFSPSLLDEPDTAQVTELIRSIHSGAPPVDDNLEFCALALGGNVSRIMIREWIELPLPRVQANIASWFDDHAMVDRWSGEVGYFPLFRLVLASGRWIRGKSGANGMYAKLGAPGEDRPDGLYRALVRTALLRAPLPPKLLAHLVHRVRADSRVDAERAALIRLALLRMPGRSNQGVLMATLNRANHRAAYTAGRIFAALEDIQRSAATASGDKAPNTTFADRYFARAVTNPAIALVAGQRDARVWVKRMRRYNKASWANASERRLTELFAELDKAGGAPRAAVLADQAEFILGYHQERASVFARIKSAADGGGDADLPPDAGE